MDVAAANHVFRAEPCPAGRLALTIAFDIATLDPPRDRRAG
jgi:hypothetical protein